MFKNNLSTAEAYYTAMGEKDMAALGKYLHPDVHFIGPLGETKGKEVLLESTKKFVDYFKALNIRAKCGSEEQATVIYDVVFPDPIGKMRSASFMSFKDGLIVKVELFFDARPFDKMKK